MKNKRLSLFPQFLYRKLILINIDYNEKWIIEWWTRYAIHDNNMIKIKNLPLNWKKQWIILNNYLYKIIDVSNNTFIIKIHNDHQWMVNE